MQHQLRSLWNPVKLELSLRCFAVGSQLPVAADIRGHNRQQAAELHAGLHRCHLAGAPSSMLDYPPSSPARASTDRSPSRIPSVVRHEAHIAYACR